MLLRTKGTELRSRVLRSEKCSALSASSGHCEGSRYRSWKWTRTFAFACFPYISYPSEIHVSSIGVGVNMLEKQQQPRWRLILSFIACCLLYAVSFGSDFSSGIPYSFLVLEPCGPNQSFAENQNESAEFQNQSRGDSASFATFPTPNTLVTATSQRNDSNVSESEIRCGGFGQGRSTTGTSSYHSFIMHLLVFGGTNEFFEYWFIREAMIYVNNSVTCSLAAVWSKCNIPRKRTAE